MLDLKTKKIIDATLTYNVAWSVKVTSTDILICNVFVDVVSTLKEIALVLKG